MPTETLREVEILLVEDNTADFRLILNFLKKSSVKNRVNLARDGQIASDYLNRVNGFESVKRPDLILLDLGLPLKNGREILSELKRDPALNSIPVIVLTGSDSPEEALSTYQAKADYYMIKPRDLDQFAVSMKYLEEVWLKKLSGLKENKDKAPGPLSANNSSPEKTGAVSVPPTPRPINVFIVEDNMADAGLIQEALKVHSRLISLTLARDEKEAIDHLTGKRPSDFSGRPDIILLDVSPSKKSGLGLLAEIRSHSELDQIPVIVLTNSPSERDARRAHDSSSNFYIKKPRSMDELFVAVHHIADIWLKGIRG